MPTPKIQSDSHKEYYDKMRSQLLSKQKAFTAALQEKKDDKQINEIKQVDWLSE